MEQKLDTKPLILIVDDNPTNLQVLGNHLREKGKEIAIATNGVNALKIAKSRLPHLILLDIMMPEMDGYEVCKRLKSDEATKPIPVIFLTAKVGISDIVHGFELGAVDYITKPFNSSELFARVDTHLSLREYQLRIERINSELKTLDNEKNEFLGIAAHDLKNPIYSISMLGKVLRDDPDLSQEEIQEFSQDIVTTADRMLELIKNLLDINAIERGKIKIEPELFNIDEILAQIVDTYQERAKVKGITLHFEKPDNKIFVYADRSATMQVMDNIISNAVKYSPHNKNIWVKLEEDESSAYFRVKDEGPGISEDDQKKLFGKFARLSAQPTGDEHSTGLGLSIVKRYIEAMNGDVWCESEIGNGAEFITKLPKTESVQ